MASSPAVSIHDAPDTVAILDGAGDYSMAAARSECHTHLRSDRGQMRAAACGSRRAKPWACQPKPIRAASTCWAFCNVLGFLSRKSRLHFFEAQKTMTAQFVIESIEALRTASLRMALSLRPSGPVSLAG